MPADVLIVEDDPIIALGLEDTILGLGVKTVRTAPSVAKALEMIEDRVPGFALLDVGLVREKSFAVAERLEALQIPFGSLRATDPLSGFPMPSRTAQGCPSPAPGTSYKRCLKGWLATTPRLRAEGLEASLFTRLGCERLRERLR
jgi:hypothetical protein